VTVAVVSWNTRDLLRRCLESLEPEVHDGRADAWVVDNGSSDGSPDMVREHFGWARLVEGVGNLGFGPAVNLVAQRSRSEWIAPANADIELEPGALAALLRAGEEHPDAGILAPRLILPDGSVQHSVFHFPTVGLTLLFNLGLAGTVPGLGDHLLLERHWDHRRPRRVDWAVGACLLVRRAAWDAIGGFDAHQWMYAEDLDLGWRARRAGWNTRYVPDAGVRHHQSAAVRLAWGDQLEARWQRSTYAWMLRRRGVARMRGVALLNLAGAAVRYVLLTPAAAVAPGRWGWRRRRMRYWFRVHLSGLAPRAKLSAYR
jgi:GT2 family glycosyltransferase